MSGWFARLGLVAATMRETRALADHETLTPAELAAYQRRQFGAMLRHAATHSSYYRERLAGIDLEQDVDPRRCPPWTRRRCWTTSTRSSPIRGSD